MTRTVIILAFNGLLLTAFARQEVDRTYKVEAGSTLSFDGTSTLHDFTCDSKKVEGTMAVTDQSGGMEILGCSILIAVKDLESGKEAMNEKMWEALLVEDHPVITYDLVSARRVSGTQGTSGTIQYRTIGTLNVAGEQREVDMVINCSQTTEGRLVVDGSTKLLMSDFKVETPTMFMGMVKTGNEITVRFHLVTTLQAQAHP